MNNSETLEHYKGLMAGLLERMPKYAKSLYFTMNELSEQSKWQYMNHINRFLVYCENECFINIEDPSDFAKIVPSMISQYLYSMDCGQANKHCIYFAIKRFFNYLVIDDYIQKNPMDRIKSPRVDEIPPKDYLFPSEIEIMLNNIKNPRRNCNGWKIRERFKTMNLAIFNLGLMTGMRVSSLLSIDVGDIDFENRVILVKQKGGTMHSSYFSENVGECLKDWLEDREKILEEEDYSTEALFFTPEGKRYQRHNLAKLLRWASKGVHKKVTPHTLRRTCATIIYNKTGDIYLTANILGHANINTTMRYARVSNRKTQRAIDIMDEIIF